MLPSLQVHHASAHARAHLRQLSISPLSPRASAGLFQAASYPQAASNCKRSEIEEVVEEGPSLKDHPTPATLHALAPGSRGPAGCKRLLLGLGALLLTLLLAWHSSKLAFTSAPGAEGFVRVHGTQFELGCRPLLVAGFNVDNVAQAPVARAGRKLQPGEESGKHKVQHLMQQAAAAGLNVLRTWAHTTDPKREFLLQVKPGEYNEDVFRGLDYVIAEAGRAGIKVVLSLVDNWHYYGGVDEYLDWSPTVPPREARYPRVAKEGDAAPEDYTGEHLEYENRRHALFFNDTSCKEMYKAHVKAVLERRNKYTGLLYRDSPAILAFDLLNEPRCSAKEVPECPQLVSNWIAEMSLHFKSLDHNHLLTIGSDGFWGRGSPNEKFNPSEWASDVGQEFLSQNVLPGIDFATIHAWPQAWNNDDSEFNALWVEAHVQEAATLLNKPLLLEEFGRKLGRGQEPPESVLMAHRNPVFTAVYNITEQAISRGQMVGSLFWRWGFQVYLNDIPGPHGVLPHQSTFHLISEHAQRLKRYAAAQPPLPGCPPSGGQAGCWVPTQSLGGLVRRCTHQPDTCAQQWGTNSKSSSMGGSGINVGARAPEIYLSREQCCRQGLGAFPGGCTIPW